MSINRRMVVVLKASSGGSEASYAQVISSLGLEYVSLPCVTFEWMNLPALLSKLCQPECYSGMILTSPRSVQAVVESLKHMQSSAEELLRPWRSKPTFLVGPATYDAAENSLGLLGIGKDTGNAKVLAELIIESFSSAQSHCLNLLFPCSSLRQDTLPNSLLQKSISVDCVTCYKTQPNPEFQMMFLDLMNSKGIPAYFVFFSPSGVRSALPVLKQADVPLNCVKLISMGPSTSQFLESLGLTPAAKASTPDPSGLKEALACLAPEEQFVLRSGEPS